VIDPLDFRLTLNDDGMSGTMCLSSIGAGKMFVPGVTDTDPDEVGTVFPGENIVVQLGPTTLCDR